MKYASMARRDFDKAIVKYTAFTETRLKPFNIFTDGEKVNKKIDRFVGGLGFNIYCEEYIVEMVRYVVESDSMRLNIGCIQLLSLIVSNYANEHAEHISDDFKNICKMVVDMLSIMSLNEMFWGNDGKDK